MPEKLFAASGDDQEAGQRRNVRHPLHLAVKQAWLFVLTDVLHGLSFGISYPTVTTFAGYVPTSGIMETVKSIIKSKFITS